MKVLTEKSIVYGVVNSFSIKELLSTITVKDVYLYSYPRKKKKQLKKHLKEHFEERYSIKIGTIKIIK